MIFKTFDSDSDKFISKIGILNRSFEQWGESIRARKIDIDNLMSAGLVSSEKEEKNQVRSLWSYLYGNKSVKQTPIDLSSFDNFDASDTLSKLQTVEKQVKAGNITWQEYFSGLKDGQKWQIKFVQSNDLSKVSLEQVEKAQNAARESAIAYNNGLKQMTFGAKAANVAMKGLAIAGNMIIYALISKGIEIAVTAIDNYMRPKGNYIKGYVETRLGIEKPFLYKNDKHGYGVFRKNLDSFLLRKTQDAGTTVLYGKTVSEFEKQGDLFHIEGIESKYMVWATGAMIDIILWIGC